jgi:putative ABC transport system permease protein
MIVQTVRMAFKAIAGNKMRSALTMLGIIIGVVAVVVLIAIGQGTTSSVTSSIEGMGTNLLTVNIRTYKNPITADDLEVLKQNKAISGIAPTLTQSVTAEAGTVSYDSGSLVGTTPSYETIRNQKVTAGRFIKDVDLENRSYVAVVGTDIADELFGTRNVVGETVKVDGYDFTIVGLLEEKGSTTSGSSDTQIIVPFTLAQRLYSETGIRTFYVSAASSADVSSAQAVVESYLNNRFNITAESSSAASSGSSSGTSRYYSVFNQTDMLDTLSNTTDTLTLMLGGIAGISLLVGGIGIMNIMLVSVSERTREIGIRKAIGASRGNVLTQFLVEALSVSLLGGLLGLGLAVGLAGILGKALGMTVAVSPEIGLMAIAFSMCVGVIFGLYPANKASKLRPIQALRYEG